MELRRGTRNKEQLQATTTTTDRQQLKHRGVNTQAESYTHVYGPNPGRHHNSTQMHFISGSGLHSVCWCKHSDGSTILTGDAVTIPHPNSVQNWEDNMATWPRVMYSKICSYFVQSISLACQTYIKMFGLGTHH